MIGKEVMDALRACIGETVGVVFVWCGKPQERQGILVAVEDFSEILVDNSSIPFVSYQLAIKKVTKNGNVLYENTLIVDEVRPLSNKGIDRLRTDTFGQEIAVQLRAKDDAKRAALMKRVKEMADVHRE